MTKKNSIAESFWYYFWFTVIFLILSIVMITTGVSEIKHPEWRSEIDANHGQFIFLVFILILRLTWSKITGILLISLGIILGIFGCYIIVSFLLGYVREKKQQDKEEKPQDEDKQKISSLVKKVAINSAKNYFQRKRNS